MLPRYYIYHQESAPGSDEEKRWIERERKLRKIIITPAMILVWVFGLMLAYMTSAWTQCWFLAKFAIVVALSGYHGWMIDYGKKLEKGVRPVSGKALRIMNEVPGHRGRSDRRAGDRPAFLTFPSLDLPRGGA